MKILHRIWTGIVGGVTGVAPPMFASAPNALLPSRPQPNTDQKAGPTNSSVPDISPEELAAKVRTIIKDPQIEITPINPQYGSWRLQVSKGKLDMEYLWLGPDGFGGLDLARPTTPDDTPFDLVDEVFQSVDEALEYLRKLAGKYDTAA